MQIEKLWKLKSFHGFFIFCRLPKSCKCIDFRLCILSNALQTVTAQALKFNERKEDLP